MIVNEIYTPPKIYTKIIFKTTTARQKQTNKQKKALDNKQHTMTICLNEDKCDEQLVIRTASHINNNNNNKYLDGSRYRRFITRRKAKAESTKKN